MAKQRMINTRFWTDDYISHLDPVEKLLFLYFLTNPATNISGTYELPLKNIALDTGLDKEMVEKIINRFSKADKIHYFEGWVYIVNFVKHQNQNSPKVQKGIEVEKNAIPQRIRYHIDTVSKGIDTLSHSNSNSNSNSNINLTELNTTAPNAVEDEEGRFIALFGGINPAYGELFKRKPQRAAAARLLKFHPLEWWAQFMKGYVVAIEDRFCPKATTPAQMEDKLAAIMAFARSKKSNGVKMV